jgi:hypothetical protein
MRISPAALALLASLGAVPAAAADLPPPVSPLPEPAVLPGWMFRASFNGWLAGVKGQAGVGPLPTADLNISFGDVLDKLDGVFMGGFTAENGTVLLGVDMLWMKLSTGANLKVGNGPLASFRTGSQLSYEQTQTAVTGFAGYRIPVGPSDLRLYGTVGFRYQGINVKIDLNRLVPGFDRSTEQSQDWIDPTIGFVFNYRINEKWYLDGMADIGGFGLASKITTQGVLSLGYRWTDMVSTSIGYKVLYTDYTKATAGGSFRYETTMHGPLLALNVHF